MKRKFKICALFLFCLWIGEIILLTGCKKDPVLPTLTTLEVSNITINTAATGGNISSDGGAEVTARGVCWGTASGPEATGSHTTDNKGIGSFTSSLVGLTPGTKYYARSYATNKVGTAYGNEVTFTTIPLVLPVLSTADVSGITSSSAISGGNITSDGNATVTARGICWSTNPDPSIDQNKTTNGEGTGSFTANITGLSPATTYHVRAYATNSVGTAYGNDISFVTLAVTPTLTTTAITSVTRTSAVSGGNITNNGGAQITARGVCWSTSPGPVITGSHTSDGTGSGTFTSSLAGLNPNTLYYVRAYATNSIGTAYGNELSFTTNPVLIPVITTSSVTDITTTTAVSGGNIINDNGGNITGRGVCWNTTGNPTISDPKTNDGTGTGVFTSNIFSLTHGTVYYVRAYATNSAGTAYGDQLRFITLLADADGNVYKTVIIGTQIWMQSDLKTTKYRDNSPIPNITDDTNWANTTSDAYSWYNNNPSYGSTFGILYNWFTVGTGKLCPSGWHVPSTNDFKVLEIYLGMTPAQADLLDWRGTDQGAQLKNTSTWNSGGNGTNTSGFSALGGGYRYGATGQFFDLGAVGYWWSSTESSPTEALYRRLDATSNMVYAQAVRKQGGKFVRCLKN